jgi:hypothetical protein
MFPNRSGQRHVDTSCLAVRRELGQKIASSWIVQRWMDRFAFQAIINARLRGGCTGKFTTNYRISDDGLGNMPIGHFKAYSEAIIRAHPMTPWRHEFVFEHAKQ